MATINFLVKFRIRVQTMVQFKNKKVTELKKKRILQHFSAKPKRSRDRDIVY